MLHVLKPVSSEETISSFFPGLLQVAVLHGPHTNLTHHQLIGLVGCLCDLHKSASDRLNATHGVDVKGQASKVRPHDVSGDFRLPQRMLPAWNLPAIYIQQDDRIYNDRHHLQITLQER